MTMITMMEIVIMWMIKPFFNENGDDAENDDGEDVRGNYDDDIDADIGDDD